MQITAMIILTVLGASGKMTKENRLRNTRLNTAAMCLSFLVTAFNVVITGFRE